MLNTDLAVEPRAARETHRSIALSAVAEEAAELAAEAYGEDTLILSLGCGDGAVLEALARRLSRLGRSATIFGVETDGALLERAEASLRPWLGEHEIVLRAEEPGAYAGASVAIVDFTTDPTGWAARAETLARVRAGLEPGGLLLLSDGQASWHQLVEGVESAGFEAAEPVIKVRGLLMLAARRR